MKKKVLLIVALALAACMLSGCSLPMLMTLFTTREVTQNKAVEYPMEVTETEEGVWEGMAYEDAAYDSLMMTAMPGGGAYYDPYVEFNTEEYAAIEENGADQWNGYHGVMEGVLDGEGFALDILWKNGFSVTAHGDNMFPDGYYGFCTAVDELFGWEW